jgi:hypothetical protein
MAQPHTFEGSLHWAGGATTDEHGKVKLPRAFVIRFKDKPPIEGSSPVPSAEMKRGTTRSR